MAAGLVAESAEVREVSFTRLEAAALTFGALAMAALSVVLVVVEVAL